MLHAAALIDQAMARTGLHEFGAPSWREGLDRVVASFNEDAALNAFGAEQVSALLVDKLANRLQIEDWHHRYPEIAAQPVERPVFGLGLPRTGSTALGVILGQDPDTRVLRTWEARQPCPPPEAGDMGDPRIAAAQAWLDATLAADPSLGGMIPMSADAATECLLLTAMDFRSTEFEAFGRMNSYNRWLLETDMEPAYRFHRRVLQLLQWRCPPTRWFLRTPAHSAFLPALDAVYPDARFVMTHRDVTRVLPSNMTLVLALSQAFTDRPDHPAMARHMIDFWEASLRRLVAFREAGNADRFHDIAFGDFQSDPIGEIRRLYAWLDQPLTAAAEHRMRRWWQAQGEERPSGSKIDFAGLGIPLDEIRDRFAFYTERYVDRSAASSAT